MKPITVGMLLFEGFELLDVFGPLEMFGMLRERAALRLLAERAGPVRSSTGPTAVADRSIDDAAWDPFAELNGLGVSSAAPP